MQKEVTIVLIILIILIVLVLTGVIPEYDKCKKQGEIFGRPTKHQQRIGCFVQLENGKWINTKNYRGQ